jgi:hypothetical protein
VQFLPRAQCSPPGSSIRSGGGVCRSVNVNHGLFDSDTAPRIERSTDFAALTKRHPVG